MDVLVSHIFNRADARRIDKGAVSALMSSIADVGIINPLRVRPARRIVDGDMTDAYEVVAGHHRLAAARKLGLVDVPCNVVDDDDLHAELAMIDENLCRADLSPAERSAQTARRKVLYEELHPSTKHGGNLEGAGVAKLATPEEPRFTAATAEATGRSERAVQRDAERGEKIAADVLEKLTGTHLDRGDYLDTLKRLPEDEQRQRVEKALSTNVRQEKEKRAASKIDADVKARAAREVAEMIAEYIPAEAWDGLKANLYAAGAKSIANELTNITGQSIMDRRYA